VPYSRKAAATEPVMKYLVAASRPGRCPLAAPQSTYSASEKASRSRNRRIKSLARASVIMPAAQSSRRAKYSAWARRHRWV